MSFLSSTGGVIGEWTAALRTGGSTGRFGPSLSQARSGLSITTDTSDFDESTYKNDTSIFDVTSTGIQLIDIPADGSYRITAEGAGAVRGRDGGFGARVIGDFDLNEGQTLQVLVGQPKDPIDSSGVGHAAGGTFVTQAPHDTNESILVVAGGGGGGHNNGDPSGEDANTGTSGNRGSDSGSGGTNGGAGQSQESMGGAGFFGEPSQAGCDSGSIARAYVNGGLGSDEGGNGSAGFGGGGCDGCSHGGGGGGYSGGGGTESSPYHGGGGGSYNNGTNQSSSEGITNDFGKAKIEFLG